MTKAFYLGLSILEFSKIIIHEFQHDDVKAKYGENTKLCYIVTDSFIVFIKTEGNYEDITKYVETGSDTSNYESERPLPKGKK